MGFRRIEQAVMWRRLDGPGHDVCAQGRIESGWRLMGNAIYRCGDTPCNLGYLVDAGTDWCVRSAHVFGTVGMQLVDLFVAAADGGWRLNGRLQRHLPGGVDFDLGFTPATKLITLRRLALAVGGHAQTDGAALRVDTASALVPSRSSYARLSECEYAFDPGDAPTPTVVSVDRHQTVVCMPGRWAREDYRPARRLPAPAPAGPRVRLSGADGVPVRFSVSD